MPGVTESLFLWLFRIVIMGLAFGFAWRIRSWLTRPAKRVVLTPAPTTRGGVFVFMLHESLFFTTLFKASLWTWLFAWFFHFGLALVLLQHLRFLTRDWWSWLNWLASMGHIATAFMLFGLLGLAARRIVVDRIRYISRVSDYLILLFIGVLALSGIALKYIWPMNILLAKDFVRSALYLQPFSALPEHAGFWLHVLLASVLLVMIPLGKLMHGPGLWLNPTRAQVDTPRV